MLHWSLLFGLLGVHGFHLRTPIAALPKSSRALATKVSAVSNPTETRAVEDQSKINDGKFDWNKQVRIVQHSDAGQRSSDLFSLFLVGALIVACLLTGACRCFLTSGFMYGGGALRVAVSQSFSQTESHEEVNHIIIGGSVCCLHSRSLRPSLFLHTSPDLRGSSLTYFLSRS